jgi:ornithine decarboxylase
VYRFSFDSTCEADKLAAEAPGASVLVRLKTIPANSTVPSEGKFGVDFVRCIELMKYAVSKGLQPYGVAFHVGSQMEDAETWKDALAEAGSLLRSLAQADIRVQMVDIGGGFPAGYETPSAPLSVFAQAVREAAAEYLPYKVQVAMEPGRALVGSAGVMLATVIGVARRGTTNWLHLDVGAFNGMMEALESLNTLRFPMRDSRQSAEQTRYSVTGPSCDSQDTILHDVPLSADLRVGDRVFIYTAGAYTVSYASRFNGFAIPEVYMLPA